MVKVAIFYAALLWVAAYAFLRGGGPERAVAMLSFLAAISSSLIPFNPHASYHGVEWGELAIDILLLAGLLVIAAYANRFWPIYVAAFQLLTVGTHLARAYDATTLPMVYARVAGELAYPGLAILAVGTYRHRRRRPEPDWSWEPA